MTKQEEEFDALLNRAEVKDWFARVQRDVFPKISQSLVVLTVWDGRPDPKMAMEIGAAILYEKPIILLCHKGARVMPKLALLADAIIEVDDPKSPEAIEKLKAALEKYKP